MGSSKSHAFDPLDLEIIDLVLTHVALAAGFGPPATSR